MSAFNPGVSLVPLTPAHLPQFLLHQPEEIQNWVQSAGFKAEPYQVCFVPAADRSLSYVLVGYLPKNHGKEFANLAKTLPEGHYHFTPAWLEREEASFIQECTLFWLRETYNFTPYKKKSSKAYPTLVWPENIDQEYCKRVLRAQFLVRDLINTPANDMGPEELAKAAESLAKEYHAKFKVIVGEDLLKENFPAIYHVGKASLRSPRLIELRWGDITHPKITLIGKGVCFDSGDAEGRLILADALTAACEEEPELIVDFATLTGAARVALGPNLPALFSNDSQLARKIINLSELKNDPLWQLPLFEPYKEYLKSSIADLNNCSTSSYAGAITAALFLKEFIDPPLTWLHVDLMAWNVKSTPGHPEGGEAMSLLTFYAYLLEKYQIKLHVAQ